MHAIAWEKNRLTEDEFCKFMETYETKMPKEYEEYEAYDLFLERIFRRLKQTDEEDMSVEKLKALVEECHFKFEDG